MKIKSLYKSKLNRRLLKWLTLILIITMLYITYITTSSFSELKERTLSDINEIYLNAYINESQQAFQDALRTGEMIKNQILANDSIDELTVEDISNTVRPALEQFKYYKGIYVLLNQNDQILNRYFYNYEDYVLNETVDDPDLSAYFDTVRDKDYSIILPETYIVGSEEILLTTIELPIEMDGKLIGVIGIDLSLEFFEYFNESMMLIENINTSIIASNDIVVLSEDRSLIGQMMPIRMMKSYYDDSRSRGHYDKNYYITDLVVDPSIEPWLLVMTYPENYISGLSNKLNVNIGLSLIVAIILITVMNSFTVVNILRPIQVIRNVLDKVYAGDMSERVEVKSKDEIKLIADGLNEVLESLQHNQEYLEYEVEINKELNSELEASMKSNERVYFETIRSLIRTIEVKDPYTAGHCDRVTTISIDIARALELDEDALRNIHYGASLHDVGKIGIHDHILTKNGKLTNEEYEEIKQHAKNGFEIIRDLDFLKNASKIVLDHHERYDGRGYPNGLEGDEISIEARIVAVADAYDAMTSSRSYRSAQTKAFAVDQLLQNRGKQFDSKVVDVFIKLLDNEDSLYE